MDFETVMLNSEQPVMLQAEVGSIYGETGFLCPSEQEGRQEAGGAERSGEDLPALRRELFHVSLRGFAEVLPAVRTPSLLSLGYLTNHCSGQACILWLSPYQRQTNQLP